MHRSQAVDPAHHAVNCLHCKVLALAVAEVYFRFINLNQVHAGRGEGFQLLVERVRNRKAELCLIGVNTHIHQPVGEGHRTNDGNLAAIGRVALQERYVANDHRAGPADFFPDRRKQHLHRFLRLLILFQIGAHIGRLLLHLQVFGDVIVKVGEFTGVVLVDAT